MSQIKYIYNEIYCRSFKKEKKFDIYYIRLNIYILKNGRH